MNKLIVKENKFQQPVRFNWIVEDENDNWIAAFQSKKDAEAYVKGKNNELS